MAKTGKNADSKGNRSQKAAAKRESKRAGEALNEVSALDPAALDVLITPIGFVEGVLGMPLYTWQDKVLGWFDPKPKPLDRFKAALCTPNGAGKSERIVASLALYWLAVHPRGKVVITTKDSKQLDNQIYPAIRKHESKLEGWKFIERLVETPTGGKCILFTTDEPGRAEGWHKEDDVEGPLLIIVDEAKSVPEAIFQAIDRCTYNALLYVSSPGVKTGRFYDCFSKPIGFETAKVGLKDCPHIDPSKIKDVERQYGADHPFTLSTLHGEFMEEDGEQSFVIPPSVVREAIENPPVFIDGPQYAFCDFAAGGDENVLAHRVGNKILPLLAWKDTNTMASVARFIMEFKKRGLKPSDIYGDGDGLGRGMLDRMEEMGWAINRVHNGSAALDDGAYENRGAEMWHTAGRTLADFAMILPPDEKLKAQLATRKMKFLSDGRLGIESKKDMAKRGLCSPDRADTVVGVMAIDSEIASGEFDQAGLRALELGIKPAVPGELKSADFGVNWTERGDGWLEVWEKPEFGRAYLACARAGEDGWSVFVLRKSFVGGDAKSRNDAVIARIKAPCEWDAALLADRLALVLEWYGHPLIVPDVRGGLDLLERLKDKGASIYRRTVFDRPDNAFSWGWELTEKNSAVPIAALSRAIRERTIDIWSEDAVRDLRSFNRQSALTNGDTMTLGIGLHCLDSACVYTPPRVPHTWAPGIDAQSRDLVVGSGACR